MKKIILLLLITVFSPLAKSQWVSLNGPGGAQLRCVYTTPGKIYTGSSNMKFHLTTNEGAVWSNPSTGLTDNGVYAMVKYGANMVVGTNSGIFYNDSLVSLSWQTSNNGLTNFSITSFCISGSKILAGTYGGGIFGNDALDTYWYSLDSGVTNQTVISLYVNGPDIYCGTYGGGIFKSTNQGYSWSEFNQGLLNFYVSCFTAAGSNMYCGTYGAGVFKSTNAGLNWTQINTGLNNTTIMGLVNYGTNVIAATQAGVFVTANAGTNWVQFNTGLSNQNITCMNLNSEKLLVGVDFAGISARNLSEVGGVGISNGSSVLSFKLNQNYPNPFNPSTNISFSLDKNSEIKLSLYDVTGKLIRVLREGFFRAGDYEFNYDFQNLSAGIYFYSLETPDKKLTNKMILTK